MAGTFASAVTMKTVFGDKRVTMGTYTASGGSTGGDITTGLTRVEAFFASATGSSIVADAPTANETFPMVTGAVTLICTANTTGMWMAIGA